MTASTAVALALAATALTAACATSAAPKDPKMAQCDAAKVQWAIGKEADQATMGRIWRESGAGLFRPLTKAQTPRQDSRPDRVNIHLDDHNRIVSIDCG